MAIEGAVNFLFERWGVPTDRDLSDPKFAICATLSTLSGLALFVIACIGAAGHFPGPALAGSVIGLSGASFVFYLMTVDLKNQKSAVIIHGVATAAIMLFGACGLTNLLYPVGVGALVIVVTVLKLDCLFFGWPCNRTSKKKSATTGTRISLRTVPEATEEELRHAEAAPMPKFNLPKKKAPNNTIYRK